MLLVFCGLPGTGKTTVANIIAKKFGIVVISTDYIRKRIFEKPTYQKFEKEIIYKVMLLLAEHLSKSGTCILDAVFTKGKNRNAVKEMAKKNDTQVCFIEFVCDEDIIFKRIAGKKRKLSDADYGIYLKLKKEYEPIEFEHIVVDTSGGMEAASLLVEDELKPLGIFKG